MVSLVRRSAETAYLENTKEILSIHAENLMFCECGNFEEILVVKESSLKLGSRNNKTSRNIMLKYCILYCLKVTFFGML